MCILCNYNENITQIPSNLQIVCKDLKIIPKLQNLTYLSCNNCPSLTTISKLPKLTNLTCENCPSLTTIPKLPNLTNLSCNNCQSLIIIPELPNLVKLNVIKCPLNLIPKLPKLIELNCNDLSLNTIGKLPSLINLYSLFSDLPNLYKLTCKNCPSLSIIPKLPNLTNLTFENCPSLTKIPKLPNLYRLTFKNCPSLTTIPKLSLFELIFDNCTSLVKIPKLKNLRDLSCNNCPSLSTIGELPELTNLYIKDCPLIEDLDLLKTQNYLENLIRGKNIDMFRKFLQRPDFDKIVTDKKKLINIAIRYSGIITEILLKNKGYSLDLVNDYNGIMTANAGFEYYKSNGYLFINIMLRTNTKTFIDFKNTHPKFVKLIELMLVEIRKNTRNDLPILYRGIPIESFDSLINSDIPINEQFLFDKSFCSTSLSRDVSVNFTNRKKCCIMKFQLPPNIHFYDYKDSDEYEILLEPNVKINFLNKVVDEDGITCYNCYLTKIEESPIISQEIVDFIKINS